MEQFKPVSKLAANLVKYTEPPVYFRWDDAIREDLIRAAYDTHAGTRYTALMHKLKKNRVQPNFVIDEAWRRYLEYWESEDFLARSRQASTNRNTEVEGPGTGPSKHGGGAVSFVTTNERLAYVRQLESSRVKLTQLEQELQRARQLGIFISSSGDQSHSLSGNGNPESISA
ncbi:hypothetical protein Syun_023009 [Stephania yunnanensis]|uniref:Transposase n=1 Tax=Stephania yunnanensis TaxID=152371 RepID=A0AAP0FF78_9MAGN